MLSNYLQNHFLSKCWYILNFVLASQFDLIIAYF